MKRFIALIVIALVVAVVVLSCGGSPVSGRPESSPTPSTATLWVQNAALDPDWEFGILGSGFPPSETVELYIAGNLSTTVSTSDAGTFMVAAEWPSLPVEVVYALEAFVGDELWATHPCVTGQ